jgi:hypothetical protein
MGLFENLSLFDVVYGDEDEEMVKNKLVGDGLLLDPVDQQNSMVSFLKEDRMLRIKKKY